MSHPPPPLAMSMFASRADYDAAMQAAQPVKLGQKDFRDRHGAVVDVLSDDVVGMTYARPQALPPTLPICAAYGVKSKYDFDPANGHKLLLGLSINRPGTVFDDQIVELFTADQMREYANFTVAQACRLTELLAAANAEADSITGWPQVYCKTTAKG